MATTKVEDADDSQREGEEYSTGEEGYSEENWFDQEDEIEPTSNPGLVAPHRIEKQDPNERIGKWVDKILDEDEQDDVVSVRTSRTSKTAKTAKTAATSRTIKSAAAASRLGMRNRKASLSPKPTPKPKPKAVETDDQLLQRREEVRATLRRKFKRAALVAFSLARFRRKTYKYADKTGKLPFRIKLAYALPQFATTSLTILLSLHGVRFYEQAGAKLSFIAFFTAVARSFDVMTDPLMGWLSDSFRSKWGRRRPFMLGGCWGYAICFIVLFSPPASLEGLSISLWFGVFYVLFYLFDTTANVPYGALGPELTDDYQERSSLFFYAKLCSFIGTLVGAAGPAILITFFENPDDPEESKIDALRPTYTVLALFFGVTYCLFMVLCVKTVKEREASTEVAPAPLVPSILRSMRNVAFRPLLTGWILDFVAVAALASMFPFFITYIVEPECLEEDETLCPEDSGWTVDSALAACLCALFVSALLSMPVWLYLSKKLGKYRTWLLYNLVNSLTNILYGIVGKGDVIMVILITVLNGIPVGGQFLIDSILADTIDYDEFLNGTRGEGAFTVFATFVPKIVSIPSQALPLALISAVGFKPSVDGDPQSQSQIVKAFIRVVFVVLPSAATFISFLVKRKFPIRSKEVNDKIYKGIELHMKDQPAMDPITGKSVSLFKPNKGDEETVKLLDHLSTKMARALVEEGPDAVVSETSLLVKKLGFLLFFCFAMVIGTFSLLDDPALSWLPSSSVIGTGMVLCLLVFSYLRLKASRQLAALPDIPEYLQTRIFLDKKRGARGGEVDGPLLVDQKEEKKPENLTPASPAQTSVATVSPKSPRPSPKGAKPRPKSKLGAGKKLASAMALANGGAGARPKAKSKPKPKAGARGRLVSAASQKLSAASAMAKPRPKSKARPKQPSQTKFDMFQTTFNEVRDSLPSTARQMTAQALYENAVEERVPQTEWKDWIRMNLSQ